MSEPSREVSALQAQLRRDKLRLHSALQSFSDAAQSKVDIRRRVTERPLLWLAGALALGLGLGARR